MKSKRVVSVLIPNRIEDGEIKVFIQRRTLDAPHSADYFGFFGGKIEEGENPEQALLREVKEELNIDITDYTFWHTYNLENIILHVFLLSVDSNFEHRVEVLEGQYGKFLNKEQILREKVIEWDRDILLDFLEAYSK